MGTSASIGGGGSSDPAVGVVNPATVSMFTVPCAGAAGASVLAFNTGTDYYIPIYLRETITIDRVAMEVTTANAGQVRVGLYNADNSWQPTTLVEDFGLLTTASTGVKTATPAGGTRTIGPGRYLLAYNVNNNVAAFRYAAISHDFPLIPAVMGANLFVATLSVARAHAAFPASGTAWTANTANTAGFVCPVFLRLSAVTA